MVIDNKKEQESTELEAVNSSMSEQKTQQTTDDQSVKSAEQDRSNSFADPNDQQQGSMKQQPVQSQAVAQQPVQSKAVVQQPVMTKDNISQNQEQPKAPRAPRDPSQPQDMSIPDPKTREEIVSAVTDDVRSKARRMAKRGELVDKAVLNKMVSETLPLYQVSPTDPNMSGVLGQIKSGLDETSFQGATNMRSRFAERSTINSVVAAINNGSISMEDIEGLRETDPEKYSQLVSAAEDYKKRAEANAAISEEVVKKEAPSLEPPKENQTASLSQQSSVVDLYGKYVSTPENSEIRSKVVNFDSQISQLNAKKSTLREDIKGRFKTSVEEALVDSIYNDEVQAINNEITALASQREILASDLEARMQEGKERMNMEIKEREIEYERSIKEAELKMKIDNNVLDNKIKRFDLAMRQEEYEQLKNVSQKEMIQAVAESNGIQDLTGIFAQKEQLEISSGRKAGMMSVDGGLLFYDKNDPSTILGVYKKSAKAVEVSPGRYGSSDTGVSKLGVMQKAGDGYFSAFSGVITNLGTSESYQDIDVDGQVGEPIPAPFDGTIVDYKVDFNGSNNYIVLEDDQGNRITMNHLNPDGFAAIASSSGNMSASDLRGMRVSKGSFVGEIGNTGKVMTQVNGQFKKIRNDDGSIVAGYEQQVASGAGSHLDITGVSSDGRSMSVPELHAFLDGSRSEAENMLDDASRPSWMPEILWETENNIRNSKTGRAKAIQDAGNSLKPILGQLSEKEMQLLDSYYDQFMDGESLLVLGLQAKGISSASTLSKTDPEFFGKLMKVASHIKAREGEEVTFEQVDSAITLHENKGVALAMLDNIAVETHRSLSEEQVEHYKKGRSSMRVLLQIEDLVNQMSSGGSETGVLSTRVEDIQRDLGLGNPLAVKLNSFISLYSIDQITGKLGADIPESSQKAFEDYLPQRTDTLETILQKINGIKSVQMSQINGYRRTVASGMLPALTVEQYVDPKVLADYYSSIKLASADQIYIDSITSGSEYVVDEMGLPPQNQPPVGSNQISEQQVRQMIRQAEASGVSPQETINTIRDRGYTLPNYEAAEEQAAIQAYEEKKSGGGVLDTLANVGGFGVGVGQSLSFAAPEAIGGISYAVGSAIDGLGWLGSEAGIGVSSLVARAAGRSYSDQVSINQKIREARDAAFSPGSLTKGVGEAIFDVTSSARNVSEGVIGKTLGEGAVSSSRRGEFGGDVVMSFMPVGTLGKAAGAVGKGVSKAAKPIAKGASKGLSSAYKSTKPAIQTASEYAKTYVSQPISSAVARIVPSGSIAANIAGRSAETVKKVSKSSVARDAAKGFIETSAFLGMTTNEEPGLMEVGLGVGGYVAMAPIIRRMGKLGAEGAMEAADDIIPRSKKGSPAVVDRGRRSLIVGASQMKEMFSDMVANPKGLLKDLADQIEGVDDIDKFISNYGYDGATRLAEETKNAIGIQISDMLENISAATSEAADSAGQKMLINPKKIAIDEIAKKTTQSVVDAVEASKKKLGLGGLVEDLGTFRKHLSFAEDVNAAMLKVSTYQDFIDAIKAFSSEAGESFSRLRSNKFDVSKLSLEDQMKIDIVRSMSNAKDDYVDEAMAIIGSKKDSGEFKMIRDQYSAMKEFIDLIRAGYKKEVSDGNGGKLTISKDAYILTTILSGDPRGAIFGVTDRGLSWLRSPKRSLEKLFKFTPSFSDLKEGMSKSALVDLSSKEARDQMAKIAIERNPRLRIAENLREGGNLTKRGLTRIGTQEE